MVARGGGGVGLSQGGETEGEGANGGVLEHHKLTTSMTEVVAKLGEAGRRRIDGVNSGGRRCFELDFGEKRASRLACFREEDEDGEAMLLVTSAGQGVLGDGGGEENLAS